eukprot:55833-Hanusia_phi.AAC.1
MQEEEEEWGGGKGGGKGSEEGGCSWRRGVLKILQERKALEIWKGMGEGSVREAGRDGVSETVEYLKR